MVKGIITTMREVSNLPTNLKDTQMIISIILKAGYAVRTAAMEGISTDANMLMHMKQI